MAQAAINSHDRHFTLSVVGALILVLVIAFSLAPRKARAQIASIAKSSVRSSVRMIIPFKTPASHATVSASQDKSSEYWPAGILFEAAPNPPAEGWRPSLALVYAVFGETEIPVAERFVDASLMDGMSGTGYSASGDAGYPASGDTGYLASGGSSGQQSGNSAGYGNSGGQAGLASGWAGGSTGARVPAAGSDSRSEPGKPVELASFHEADSSGGLLITGTDSNGLDSGILDVKSSANTLSVKAMATGLGDPFTAVPEQVLEAPTVSSASRSRGKMSGYREWTPATTGAKPVSHPLTSGGGSRIVNSGNTGSGGKKRKNHPSGDRAGLAQSALSPTGRGSTSDLRDPVPSLAVAIQAIPEPGSLQLFVIALLGIVVLRLRSIHAA